MWLVHKCKLIKPLTCICLKPQDMEEQTISPTSLSTLNLLRRLLTSLVRTHKGRFKKKKQASKFSPRFKQTRPKSNRTSKRFYKWTTAQMIMTNWKRRPNKNDIFYESWRLIFYKFSIFQLISQNKNARKLRKRIKWLRIN